MFSIKPRGFKTTPEKSKGFTLIELLVVILIITLMATIITVSVETARKRGRDSKRIADLTVVSSALQLYYADHHTYPGRPAGSSTDAKRVYIDAVQSLMTGGYTNNCPQDPGASGLKGGGATTCATYDQLSGADLVGYRYSTNATTLSYVLAARLENLEMSTVPVGDSHYGDYVIKNGEPSASATP